MHLESLEQRVVLSGNAFDISDSGLVEPLDSEAERVTVSATSGDADGEYTGDGISVGVISDSAWNYGSSVEAGGLPEGVVRIRDVYASDEGRAALEVVHQVAPDAGLFFSSGYGGEAKFADAIRKLAKAGADIIVDDLTYYSEPFFQDGVISSAIAEVHAEYDVLYVSAAGNHGNSSYESLYRASDEGLHDFDESDEVTTRQHFTIPALEKDSEVRLVLQWNDPFYTEDQVVHDFDVFLYDSEENLVASGEAENLATQEPLEQLSLAIDAGQAKDYFVEITGHDVDPADTVHLKYILFGPEGMEIVSFATDSSTAVGHVMSDFVLSVGASDGETGEFVKEYSSGGSSTVYYDANGVPFEEPRTRTGVEVVAATDTTTGVNGFEDFGGTSASAARVAGIAAVAWSAAPHLTSTQLRQVLQNSAIDIYEPGWDELSGHGRVEMDAAVEAALTVSDTLSPSASGVSPGERSGWFVPKLAVVFSEPMDPTIAGNSSHYTLESSGLDETWNTADDVTYAVSAKYVAVTNTVEISPVTVSELPFGDYRVTLSSDLEDVAGNPLTTSAGPTYEFSVDSGAPIFELPEAVDAQYSLSEDGKLVVSDVYNFSVGNENYYQLRTATVDPSGHAQPYQVLQTDPNADQLSGFAEATTNYIIYRFITIYVYGGGGGGGSSAAPVSTTPTVNISGNNGVISWSEIAGSTITYHLQLLDSYGTPVGGVLDLETVDQYGSVPPNIISTDSHIIVHTLQKHSTENHNVTRIVIYDREGNELTSIVPFSGRASSNSKLYDRMILDGSGNIVISHVSENVLRIARYSVDGTLLGTEEIASSVAVDWEQYSPVIVGGGNGDLLAAYWTISTVDDNLHLKVRRRDHATGSWGEPREIAISDAIRWFDLAVGDDGRFVVVWQNQSLSLLAQKCDPNLNAVGDVTLVTQLANTSSADVLFHGADRFVVVWQNQQNFSRWFMWDSIPETIDVGPWVTGFEVTETPDGLVDCQVHFDREMDWNVIVRQHFSIRAPNGFKVPIQQLVPSDDGKSVTLVFSHTWPIYGRYDLEVSHLVQDLAGRMLNQDGDGLNGEPDDDRYRGIWLYLPDESTPVPYVEDFNSGEFGTLGGWRFAVDRGAGFALTSSTAMEGTHYLEATLETGYYDAHARAGLVLDLSGWDGESELTLDYLSRRNTSDYHTQYALSVSGSGEAEDWTSVLTYVEPVSETTEHHVVDLAAALEAAGIVADEAVHVQWRFRLDNAGQAFGLDRVRVGSQDAMGASVSSLTAEREGSDRVTGLTVTFDEVMDAGAFTAEDVSVVSPLGSAVGLSGGPVDSGDGRTFAITFSQPQALSGTYPVTIGPEVLDVAGNRMNQDRDARNVDGFSGQFEIAAVAVSVPPDYVEDFNSGDFGTLVGWRFAVDSGAGFVLASSTAMEGTHYLEAALDTGYYDAHARAGLVLDLSGWDGESELTLDYLSRRNTSDYNTRYSLHVSGSGESEDWTSVLTYVEPVPETTEHHVVDLGAALEAAGIVADEDVHVQWRFRLDNAGQAFGLDRVRVGSQDGMGASVSSLTANRDDADRVTGLTVTFDEVMDAGQFTADDVSVVSPLGTAVPLSGDPVDGGDGRTFTITFSHPQALSGTYPVTIGPEVLDAAGNRMNQDHDARNVDGFSGQFEIAAVAVAVPPDYVGDFNSGEFGTLGGWRFAVDGGAGFVLASSTAMEGTHYLEATLETGYYDAYARAGLVLDLSGWDGESELTLDYLSRRNTSYHRTQYALLVSGSGESEDWTSVLTNMEPVSETTEHHVVDLGAALEAAGIVADEDVHVQWRFRLDHGTEAFGLDRVRVGSRDAMGASVSSLTAERDGSDRVTGLTVTFDEVMDAGEFTAEDVSVLSPLGTAVPLSGGPVDGGDGRTFTITFTHPQALSGVYPVTIGPEVLDVAGNWMNQDHDARNVDGFSGEFEIAAVAVPPDYVGDFNSGEFGTLGGWRFAVDGGAGFVLASSTAMEGTHYLEAALDTGYYDAHARAGLAVPSCSCTARSPCTTTRTRGLGWCWTCRGGMARAS